MHQKCSLSFSACLIALACAACGGGGGGDGGGSTPPAPKFANTDDVAAAYRQSLLSATAIVGGFAFSSSNAAPSAEAKSTTKSAGYWDASPSPDIQSSLNRTSRLVDHPLAAPNAGPVSKSTATSNCTVSGTISETTDDTTAYTDDGTTVYSQCVDNTNNSDGSEYRRTTTDGQGVVKCIDNSQTQDNCGDQTVSYGTGSNTPLSLAQKYSDGSRDTVDTLNLKLRVREGSGQIASVTSDGSMRHVDNVVRRSVSFSYTNFSYAVDGSGQQQTLSFDGSFAVTGDLTRCTTLPSVKVSTPLKLQAAPNSSSQFSSGQLSFTDPSGQTAQMVFTSNGASVSVGGISQAYTYDQLAAFCN